MNRLSLVGAAAIVGLGVSASFNPAHAVMITIQLQVDGGGFGAPVASGTDTLVSFAGAAGGPFKANSISASGSPPNPLTDLLGSTALDVTASAPGPFGTHELDILITASGITGPTGTFAFASSLTSNTLPAGWSVEEDTFLNGAPLSSHLFPTIGSAVLSATAATGLGPYSIEEEYKLVATSNGEALSTIDVSVPGPVVGAGLPGLLVACGSLLALARRRRSKFAAV